MIKLNIYLRFALIALSLIAGVLLTVVYSFWYALPFYLTALVLLAGYVLLGTIQSASELMQAQQTDAAEQRLNLTKFPQYLYPANKAYYYMLKANIALTRKDTKGAEALLKQASAIEMPTGNESAVVQLQLANLAAQRGTWPEVNQRLQSIRKLTVTEPMILEQVVQLEKAYRNRGNVQLAQRMGGRNGMATGGKRRRPKMR